MCQLHFVKTPYDMFNRNFILAVTMISARERNDDGIGFHSPSWGVFKTELSANRIGNFGKLLHQHPERVTEIMAHTRSASPGIEITQKNAHPFEGKRFILAHNGRLYKKDEKVAYSAANTDTDGMSSDSLEFLNALEKTALKNPKLEFIDIMNETMEQFKGKFALLIYDKVTNIYYAIRGKTATLFYVPIFSSPAKNSKVVGYTITTVKDDLFDATLLAVNMAALYNEKLGIGEPIELKTETIYRLDQTNATEIGEVKENAVSFFIPASSAIQTYRYGYGGESYKSSTSGLTTYEESVKPYIVIADFAKKNRLSLPDLDKMFLGLFDVGLLSVTNEDVKTFISLIPSMTVKKKIRKFLVKSFVIPMFERQYEEYGLKFPWMINSDRDLLKVCASEMKKLDSKK
jgi:predicted glutamine amidotransferase